jgi:hypothetical protein
MCLRCCVSFLKKNKKASHGKSNTSFEAGVAKSAKDEFSVNDLHTYHVSNYAYLYHEFVTINFANYLFRVVSQLRGIKDFSFVCYSPRKVCPATCLLSHL